MKIRKLAITNIRNLWCATYAAEFVRLHTSKATRNAPRNAMSAISVADDAVKYLLEVFEHMEATAELDEEEGN